MGRAAQVAAARAGVKTTMVTGHHQRSQVAKVGVGQRDGCRWILLLGACELDHPIWPQPQELHKGLVQGR
ncbi:MAG: hypothetical protein AMXMBFR64_26440 [Myxococcales bacterium]